MPAIAQTPTPAPDPRPHSRDLKLNDPSTGDQLGLDEILDQRKFARGQLLRGIFQGEYLKQIVDNLFHKRYGKVVRKHPEWFELLKNHQARYVPQKDHSPAMINAGFEFENISNKAYGYCWGFVTLIRNFSILSFYDPALKPTDRAGNELSPETNREQWVQFYEKKIDEVAIYRKATVIPGFANFRELSLVPELELYLKLKTMQIWRSLAIRGAGLGSMLRTLKDMSPTESLGLVDDIEARLARHEMPKLLINSKARMKKPFSFSKHQHVILVYGLTRDADGTAHLLVWDPNFYAETLVKKPLEIRVDPQGGMFYEPWREENTPDAPISTRMARVEIAPEDGFETVDYLVELRRFCKDEETAMYCESSEE